MVRHVLAVVIPAGCFGMAYWQWTRAMEGSMLSWGYSFQWPLFGLAAIALWLREVRIELRKKRGDSVESEDPPLVSSFDRAEAPAAQADAEGASEPETDEDAYNHYLAWLAANPDRRPSDYPGIVP